MPYTSETYIGGMNARDADKVRLRWHGLLPIPGEDAEPRQVLDFAAIVALNGSENSFQLLTVIKRALDAYQVLYGVSPLPFRD